MSTHIYVISSENQTSVISKLESVFKVLPDQSNVSYKSPNLKIPCYLSKKEKVFIEKYLAHNYYFKFNHLKHSLETASFSADNMILSSYLRSQGYFPGSLKMDNGSSSRLWAKQSQ
jgi:hypothetical protein